MLDKNTIEASARVNNGTAWKASVVHALTKQDEIKVAIDNFGNAKTNDPTVTYTRKQDNMELSLYAPVRSDICADARFKITHTIDL